ncbi:ORF35 [Felid gammaherpesvirus 1]|uniref:ORF35 n=1 Tax=Felid gammaherpesvirus 1 TaxID=2560468 RepID=A0A0M4M471_9GAMA|nr:ORF35 [Felis catus gammaherpesvirus 1]ALE14747.1 ORF35 [Felis catus gammaherpesvirus 1]
MALSNNLSKNLLSKYLEAEINKKTSISTFDRFGEKSVLFQKQFQDTKTSIKGYKTLKQKLNVESAIETINNTAESTYQEYLLLSHYNLKKVREVEKLCDKVRDLKEDFDFELQDLIHRDDGQENTHEDEDVTDTILSWKLQGLPDAPK